MILEHSGVIAIDPGPAYSALVSWNGSAIGIKKYATNEAILALLLTLKRGSDPLVIEQVASYGMPVGAEVFETVYWSGRFAQAYGAERVHRSPRLRVKLHLCHDSRAKDGNIRQALLDRFGGKSAIGTKKAPGLLYGVSGDVWAAFGLAVCWWDNNALTGNSTSASGDAKQEVAASA